MNADWDNLLILDACRADMFDGEPPFGERVSTRLSPGSESWEFMQSSFDGRTLHDTVYVTANPHTSELPSDTFHAVINLLDHHWDDQAHTVLPETVVEETKRVFAEYPQKRIITHFMQPHVPFIGDLGRRIEQRGILGEDEETPRVWDRLRQGTVNARTARAAYRENLELVLPYVAELMQELGGRSVVTADHGNVFGRLGVYGHPHDTYLSGLVEVPWFVTNRGERRQIVAGETGAEMPTVGDSDELAQRLAHLGYIDE
jgi:hypothetical protein